MNMFKKLFLLIIAGNIVNADLCFGAKRQADDPSKGVDNRDTKKRRAEAILDARIKLMQEAQDKKLNSIHTSSSSSKLIVPRKRPLSSINDIDQEVPVTDSKDMSSLKRIKVDNSGIINKTLADLAEQFTKIAEQGYQKMLDHKDLEFDDLVLYFKEVQKTIKNANNLLLEAKKSTDEEVAKNFQFLRKNFNAFVCNMSHIKNLLVIQDQQDWANRHMLLTSIQAMADQVFGIQLPPQDSTYTPYDWMVQLQKELQENKDYECVLKLQSTDQPALMPMVTSNVSSSSSGGSYFSSFMGNMSSLRNRVVTNIVQPIKNLISRASLSSSSSFNSSSNSQS
jgi:hypothetical protein